MPNPFGILPTCSRQRAVIHGRARSQALKDLNDIYERLEHYDDTHIPTSSYASLNVRCGTLLLDSDGKSLDTEENCSSPFFEPRAASWVPNLALREDLVRDRFHLFQNNWEEAMASPLMGSLMQQTNYLCSCVECAFGYFDREIDHPEDVRSPRSVEGICKWRRSGRVIPQIFTERFYLDTFPFNGYTTKAAYVSSKQLLSTKEAAPHTLITIAVAEEPSEDLFKAEAMVIAAAMISRLEGDECMAYSVIPITLVTAMGGRKARVIQAYPSGQFLVLSKTQVFDFATWQMLTANTDTLLGLMGSDQVGDPADPDHILKADSEDFLGSVQQLTVQQDPESSPNTDTGRGSRGHTTFQSIRKFLRPARETSAAPGKSQESPTPRPSSPKD